MKVVIFRIDPKEIERVWRESWKADIGSRAIVYKPIVVKGNFSDSTASQNKNYSCTD